MKLKYSKDDHGKDILMSEDGVHQVMMEWEKEYMKECVQLLEPHGHVLEVGFGLGYSASEIQKYPDVITHTIIECSPVVWEKVDEFKKKHPKVILMKGRWQDMLKRCGKFDSIFFDDFDFNPCGFDRFTIFIELVLKNNTHIGSSIVTYDQSKMSCPHYDCCSVRRSPFKVDIPDNCKYAKDMLNLTKITKEANWNYEKQHEQRKFLSQFVFPVMSAEETARSYAAQKSSAPPQ